jgi:hypothetical protein
LVQPTVPDVTLMVSGSMAADIDGLRAASRAFALENKQGVSALN